jgi:hypothetical protein
MPDENENDETQIFDLTREKVYRTQENRKKLPPTGRHHKISDTE